MTKFITLQRTIKEGFSIVQRNFPFPPFQAPIVKSVSDPKLACAVFGGPSPFMKEGEGHKVTLQYDFPGPGIYHVITYEIPDGYDDSKGAAVSDMTVYRLEVTE